MWTTLGTKTTRLGLGKDHGLNIGLKNLEKKKKTLHEPYFSVNNVT